MILLFDFGLIIAAVAIFTLVILALSFMLIFARKKLIPQGDVKIIVNGDTENPMLVKPGVSLLTCLLYTSPSPRDLSTSRMPSSA